jgi:ERF superfamily
MDKKVYQSICAVQLALSKHGISKDKQGAGYKFRGIDDVYNAIAPLLAQNNLCILPRMTERNAMERIAKSGGALYFVTVKAEFDFVCALDGSMHTVCTYGEAMDSSDKATNKAMSAAYKYACFQAFAIPTEGDNDADAQTPEAAPALVLIDADQSIYIDDLLRDSGSDKAAFFAWVSKASGLLISKTSQIPQNGYEAIVKQLLKAKTK